MRVWRPACALVSVVNGLDSGRVNDEKFCKQYVTVTQQHMGQMKSSHSAASLLATHRLVSRVAAVVRARRGECLTGVHWASEYATARLLKTTTDEHGYLRNNTHKQVPLISDRMIEPDPNIVPINMLQHLPTHESIFYSAEENVIDRVGKSREAAWELEARFAFVGGSEREYVKYLRTGKKHSHYGSGLRLLRSGLFRVFPP